MVGRLISTVCLALAAGPGWPDSAARVEILVPGSVMQAVEGIDLGPDGAIYGTSIHAREVYRIDPVSGEVTVAIASPYGESDDVAVGPKGSPAEGILAWTAQRTGQIRIQRPGGMPVVALDNAPRVNPIAFTKDGRLFTAQVGAGEETLWELDVIGTKPPRVVAKGQGRVNGFGFGPDGKLYAPNFGSDELFAIDVDSGRYKVITRGVGSPAAAKVDAAGNVWSVDYKTGDLWQTDPESGESQIIANFPEPIDNLTIDPAGTIYLASLADSGIIAFEPATKQHRFVTQAAFTVPLGLAITTRNGKEVLLAADPFGYRFIDLDTGAITREPEMWSTGSSSAVAASETQIVTTYSDFERIRRIDRGNNEATFSSGEIESPRGVVLTPAGDAIIADANAGRLLRLTGDALVEAASGLNEPVALLMESDNAVLVTEVGSGTISRVQLESGRKTVLTTGLHNPRGIARMKDGRVAVVQPAGGQVVAIDLASGEREVIASGLALSTHGFDLPDNTPLGIAVSGDGTIFVSCAGDNSVAKISL